MPNTPVTRGDVAELAKQVGQLQREVHGLVQTVSSGLGERPTTTDVRRGRKRFARWALAVLLVASVLQVLTIGTIVSRCFLVPPQGFTYTICSAIPGYSKTERDSKDNLSKFTKLLGEIPKNAQVNQQQQAEIARQQREIAHLRAVLRRHGIKA